MTKHYMLPVGYLALALFPAVHVLGGSDPCENPKTIRIGVIALDRASNDPDLARVRYFERKFQEALIKRLAFACLVRSLDVFSEPENFPVLKGSLVFELQAQPSLKNPDVAAIAVRMDAVQGPYIGQEIPLGPGLFAVLVESDADFDIQAQVVVEYWRSVGKQMDKHPEVFHPVVK